MAGKQDPSSHAEQIKDSVFRRFQLNRAAVAAFQQAGENDPTRGQVDDRTRALLDIWSVFQQYKVQTLKTYMLQDLRSNLSSAAREESFAYYDSVNDVLRAMIYGASCADLRGRSQVEPRLQPLIDRHNPYAECLVLLTRTIPPDTSRGRAIQTDLKRLLEGLVNSNGDTARAERQIDPHLAVADDAVRRARDAAEDARNKTPEI